MPDRETDDADNRASGAGSGGEARHLRFEDLYVASIWKDTGCVMRDRPLSWGRRKFR